MAYYTGNGVFHDDKTGKDIGFGQELPKHLDKEFIAKLIKNGKASEKAPTAAAPADGEVERLTALVVDLRAKLAATPADGEVEALQDMVKELTDQLAAANKTIEDLTAQLMTPAAAPVEAQAGPKK